MKIGDFQAYTTYLSLKLHFTSDSYDYFKYNGKVSASPESLDKRKDKYFFKRLAKKYEESEIVDFFVSNLILGKIWIGDMDNDAYEKRKGRIQSLEYIFKNDIEMLLTNPQNGDILFNSDEIFDCKKGHPYLLKAYLGKKVCLETLVILNKLLVYSKQFDTEISEKFIWPKVSLLLRKYEPFVNIDRKNFKRIILEAVDND